MEFLLGIPAKLKSVLAQLDIPSSQAGVSKSQIYTTGSGNFTVPAGVSMLSVLLVGAGAGGASGCYDNTSTYSVGGGGGGGGEVKRFWLPVTPLGTVAYAVGAGGAGSAGLNSGTTTAGGNGAGVGAGGGGSGSSSGSGTGKGGDGGAGYILIGWN